MSATVLESISFGQPVARPKVTRNNSTPNPFAKAVQEFIDAGDAAADKAVPFEIPMGKATPQKIKGKETGKTEHKDVLKVLSRLRAAAPDGYGVRTSVNYDHGIDGKAKKGAATVAFWVKAKPADDAAEPAAVGGDGTAAK